MKEDTLGMSHQRAHLEGFAPCTIVVKACGSAASSQARSPAEPGRSSTSYQAEDLAAESESHSGSSSSTVFYFLMFSVVVNYTRHAAMPAPAAHARSPLAVISVDAILLARVIPSTLSVEIKQTTTNSLTLSTGGGGTSAGCTLVTPPATCLLSLHWV